MVRELDEPARAGRATAGRTFLDGAGVRGVERAALGRQQLVVDRLLHQGVAESIALDLAVRVDDEELGVDRLAQGRPQLDLGQPADLGEHGVLDLAAGDRGNLDEPARRLRAGRQADEEHAP